MAYQAPQIPIHTTAHQALIDPKTQKAAVTFEMRFATIGTNSRTLRILEAIQQAWFPNDAEGKPQPIRAGDDYNAATWLAVLIPVTHAIRFDFSVYDTPELRSLEFFWRWLTSDIFIDAARPDEITDDVERLAAIWPMLEAISTALQDNWKDAHRSAQVRYPARPEMRIMTAEEEAKLKQIDPN